jgi:hypothetical protein
MDCPYRLIDREDFANLLKLGKVSRFHCGPGVCGPVAAHIYRGLEKRGATIPLHLVKPIGKLHQLKIDLVNCSGIYPVLAALGHLSFPKRNDTKPIIIARTVRTETPTNKLIIHGLHYP